MQTAGEVGILNVGAGDVKISFDPSDPAERIRAARIVKDMLRRGYALLVKNDDGTWTRALGFDEERCEYIIADFDPHGAGTEDAGDGEDEEKERGDQAVREEAAISPAADPAPRRCGRPRRVQASKTSAVAVSRSAGG
jgi:hypothetical protein